MANEEHLAILKQGIAVWNQWRKDNPGVKPDLSWTDLFTADLHQVNFTETDLSGARLLKANLSGADLHKANLSGADLRGINLSGAKLISVNFSGANLISVNLSGAKLVSVNLSGAKLVNAKLHNVNLCTANLHKANLHGADFRGANLNKADLSEADLSGADLRGADLSDADLGRADLSWVKLINVNFRRAHLIGAKLYDIDLKGVDLGEVDLRGVDIRIAGPLGGSIESFPESVKPGATKSIKEPRPTFSTKKVIERFPNVSLRNKVPLGQVCILRVAVTQQPLRKELEKAVMRLEASDEAESIAIDVLVTAEDFEILGDDYRPLTVPVDKDSEPILFQMIPQSEGEKKVKVEFFQNGRYVGGITTATTVMLPTELFKPLEMFMSKQVATNGTIELQKGGLPPDLTILITESKSGNDQMRYSFKLHSPAIGLYYYTVREELAFSGAPSKWMNGLYEELGKFSKGRKLRAFKTTEMNADDIAEALSAIGTNLYEKLFPRELKELWEKRIKNKVSSIMIISDEPSIPWEIVKPFYENEVGDIIEEPFLCEQYLLTRWIAGPPPPNVVKISQGALIAPAAIDLPNIQREALFLRDKKFVIDIEPQLSAVRRMLKQGGFELIHFACHGSFDPEEHEQSIIYLTGGDKLKSRDISGERKNFGKNKPFIFINACQTARADFSLVGIGSWANTFIAANASAFLGSSWEVNDELAYRFSKAFYQALLDGKAIGQAMQEARLEIRNDQDATWLAYTVYADPLAKVIFV